MLLVDLYYYFTNLPRYHVFFVLATGYFFYYIVEVVKVSCRFIWSLKLVMRVEKYPTR
jgi:hypothetical protein